MWFYLFGKNMKYPDPLAEIKALEELDKSGEEAYLKLSPRDDAPLKNAEEGATVYLCTRDRGEWVVHGEAAVIGPPRRGTTPDSMLTVYGPSDANYWWRRIGQLHLYETPKGEVDLGLTNGTLPKSGQAHVIHPSPYRGSFHDQTITVTNAVGNRAEGSIVNWREFDPSWLPGGDEATFAAELLTYRDHLDEILHQGQARQLSFVAIKGSEILGYYRNRRAAINDAVERLGPVPVLIKRIVETEPGLSVGGVVA